MDLETLIKSLISQGHITEKELQERIEEYRTKMNADLTSPLTQLQNRSASLQETDSFILLELKQLKQRVAALEAKGGV